MNSRDAAFDESIKEIIEATAAEAAAAQGVISVDPADTTGANSNNSHVEPEEEADGVPTNRKKRKRTEDDRCMDSYHYLI